MIRPPRIGLLVMLVLAVSASASGCGSDEEGAATARGTAVAKTTGQFAMQADRLIAVTFDAGGLEVVAVDPRRATPQRLVDIRDPTSIDDVRGQKPSVLLRTTRPSSNGLMEQVVLAGSGSAGRVVAATRSDRACGAGLRLVDDPTTAVTHAVVRSACAGRAAEVSLQAATTTTRSPAVARVPLTKRTAARLLEDPVAQLWSRDGRVGMLAGGTFVLVDIDGQELVSRRADAAAVADDGTILVARTLADGQRLGLRRLGADGHRRPDAGMPKTAMLPPAACGSSFVVSDLRASTIVSSRIGADGHADGPSLDVQRHPATDEATILCDDESVVVVQRASRDGTAWISRGAA